MTSAILVDDEENTLRYLQRRLNQLWPELTVIATAPNGRAALQLSEELQPDIVFLDIQMPGLSGLQVAGMLDPEIRVVFVTAYDEFAVSAFETAAVDYLLKPVDDARLQLTISRLKETTTAPDDDELKKALREITQHAGSFLQWLRSQKAETTQLVPVDSVVFFQSDSKYTSVATSGEDHLIRTSIRELESQLDPNVFWRVNRGVIVRVSEIASAHRDIRGRYTLKLKSRPEQLRTSPKYSHLFKAM
jgi:DNA-binding LytR/AlgR family response regulator